MLIDPKTWHQHRLWFIATLAAAIGAVAWYFSFSRGLPDWPGGSSLPGFWFGVVGGLIILFEMALWWRKKVRTWRIGRTQVWLRAHIWLGLLSVPLIVLHSGFVLGGQLSTVLMVLFIIVIASGIWGLALQQFLPRRMLESVPAETIYSQIEHVMRQQTEEAERLVLAVCGPAAGAQPAAVAVADEAAAPMTIGALRAVGGVQGKVLLTSVPAAPVADAEPLRDFFRAEVRPYLEQGAASGSPLRQANRATVLFQDVKIKLPSAAHEPLAALEGLCTQRRQLDLQRRLHFWLHSWLWVHLPLSAALVLLMFVHIGVALKYW
ncbi:MAG: hypothetical protein JNM56_15265 [Planctomycetia bacterium]|nr:hypothetical protein [Planctomycetia bacterium]